MNTGIFNVEYKGHIYTASMEDGGAFSFETASGVKTVAGTVKKWSDYSNKFYVKDEEGEVVLFGHVGVKPRIYRLTFHDEVMTGNRVHRHTGVKRYYLSWKAAERDYNAFKATYTMLSEGYRVSGQTNTVQEDDIFPIWGNLYGFRPRILRYREHNKDVDTSYNVDVELGIEA